jgi:hypothetical protein
MTKDYRIFAASPGDVQAERETLARVVNEVNQTHGAPLGYRLEVVRWETDVFPGGGRPQQVINDQIGSYNIFVGIMWRRFGTPTGGWGSGTEEEFRIAYRAWEQNKSIGLMFYFCQKPFMPSTLEELDQLRQVLTFRRELESKALVWDYPEPGAFADNIRKHICLRLNSMLAQGTPKTQPDDETVRDLQQIWTRMDPDLQRAFSVAYNDNRRAGDGGIQTRDLFAALLRINPLGLRPIVEEIPKAALPAPTQGSVLDEPYIIQERPWLSHCVASSIRRLSKQLPEGQTLTAADVFADIARNGSGESVRLLRQHNIGPAVIDSILKRKNIQVLGG